MPENDASREKFAHEQSFIDLIDANESRDLGITTFEEKMQATQDALMKRFGGRPWLLLNEVELAQEKLNDDWNYAGCVARVSGRVYLVDTDIIEVFPSGWSEPITDEDGFTSFFVEDVSLRSQGIEVIPIRDDEGITTDIKVTYAFSLEDDDTEEPILNAYLGELAVHEYATPTPEEAHLRFERSWPEEYTFIKELMVPDALSALPKRLAFLAKRFQGDMKDSAKFREYLTVVVNDMLQLDRPYAVTITGGMAGYDGEDPYDSDDPGTWLNLSVNGKATFLVYEPRVHFIDDKNDLIRASVTGETFNDEDGDKSEYINVYAENIKSFRSTRALRSLVSKALEGTNEGGEYEHNDTALSRVVDTINDTQVALRAEQTEESTSVVLEHIRTLEMLDTELKKVAKLIKKSQQTLYFDREEALEAARELLKTEIVGQLIGAGLMEHHELEFSGRGALLPNHDDDLPDMSQRPSVYINGIDSEAPFVALEEGDSIKGIAYKFIAHAKQTIGSDGETMVYQISPALAIDILTETRSLLGSDEVPLVRIVTEERAFVPLDGSAEIKLVALEEHKAEIASLDEIKEVYGPDSQLVLKIHTLHDEFMGENKSAYTSLESLGQLTYLDKYIKHEVQRGKSALPALLAVERLFIQRAVQMAGYIYRIEDGVALHDDSDVMSDDDVVQGTIIDVRTDNPAGNITFVVQSRTDEILYMPLHALTRFRF